MTRFVIDAETLVHVLEGGRSVAIRSQVVDLLLQKVPHGHLTEQKSLAFTSNSPRPTSSSSTIG